MILQYCVNGGECYSESESIGLYQVDISDLKEKMEERILERLFLKVPSCRETTIIDINNILEDKKIKEIKLAILSDGKEKSNNKVLLFNECATVYLLNNEGKTIRKL